VKRTEPGHLPYHMQSPVLLAQPALDRVLPIFFGVLLATIIAFCAATSYSRTESARGEIAAASGFSTVVAEESGVISDIAVRAGQFVEKGQPLARLSRPQMISEQGDTTVYSLDRMREALRNIDVQLSDNLLSVSATRQQISQIRRGAGISSAAAVARRGLTDQRRRVAQTRLQGLEELAAEGVVTSSAVDQARVHSMQLLQEAADTDLTINEIGRGRDERVAALEVKIRDLSTHAMTLRIERLQTEKQMAELQTKQAFMIVAPESGVVAAISIRPGQRVEGGQRIFAVAKPSARLTAILEVPPKAIGLIEPGQRVAIKYDAFPYQTYGMRYGRVTRVESASLQGGQTISADGRELDRMFMVEVAPEDKSITAYGRPRPLKVGMMLTADVEVERRSILAWWLSPILSLSGRFT
jgi:membrane fusion protein